MPPPIPLSGASAWYSAGSHSGSASSSANRGLIPSQASSGEEAPAIVAWTSATNARTTGVSRTNSALVVIPPLFGTSGCASEASYGAEAGEGGGSPHDWVCSCADQRGDGS